MLFIFHIYLHFDHDAILTNPLFIWFDHFVLKERRISSHARESSTNADIVLKKQRTHHIHKSPQGVLRDSIKRIESGINNEQRCTWSVGFERVKSTKQTPEGLDPHLHVDILMIFVLSNINYMDANLHQKNKGFLAYFVLLCMLSKWYPRHLF